MARIRERFVHHSKIVGIRFEARTNAIDVAERGKELERSWKKASALEEVDQLPGARMDEAFAYRRRDGCAGIKQELGTCEAGEVLFADWVATVAEGTGSHTEQPTFAVLCPPR